jgi:hypothetical protein
MNAGDKGFCLDAADADADGAGFASNATVADIDSVTYP